MKTVVWRHRLPERHNALHLARGAKILHFAFVDRDGRHYLWEAHDADEPDVEARTFAVIGTGQQSDVDPARHLGTAVSDDAETYHLFETTPTRPHPAR